MHLELTVKFFSKEKLQVHRYKGHKESVSSFSFSETKFGSYT